MSVHVMVDLETLGTDTNAHILSIGAVRFDETGILDKFHVGVRPESCEFAGLKASMSTVTWWLDETAKDPAAWRAYTSLDKVDLWNALEGFAQWYTAGDGVDIAPLWGNGAAFDNVILRHAYKVCNIEFPPPFWLDRCYRTMKNLAPEVSMDRLGTHHSAADDAASQAIHLIQICRHLGIKL